MSSVLPKILYPPDLLAPNFPLLSAVAGGSLAARIYYVQTTLIISATETAVGPEASIALNRGELLNVTSPIVGPNAPTSYSVYVGASSGGEKRQASGIALGTAWTEPTSGLTAGPAPTAETAANVLQFKFPPRNLPAFDYKARRHDNVATSGIRESIFEFSAGRRGRRRGGLAGRAVLILPGLVAERLCELYLGADGLAGRVPSSGNRELQGCDETACPLMITDTSDWEMFS